MSNAPSAERVKDCENIDDTPIFDFDEALRSAIRGGPAVTDAHLQVIERDVVVGTTKTVLHCYRLSIDGNGLVRFKPLAEFLRDRIIEYGIPRRTVEQAQRLFAETCSPAAVARLHERARSLFTHLAQSGEGGELLLFAMAEAVFGLTQIICKMSLKTSTIMHYHGADGVYATARDDGGLNLYWGESKIYNDATTAIRDCLASLAPFLFEPEGEDAQREQDLLLINEFANFSDERMVLALKRFLERDDPKSLLTRHCGIALTAFDSTSYECDDATIATDQIERALRNNLASWTASVERRINHERLESFDIHFICVPIPSAEVFRNHFLQLLGVDNED
jgi:Cap4 SAVED domain